MKIEIEISCGSCGGFGVNCDRHPNDPAAQDIDCYECDGSGSVFYVEDYESVSVAKIDWPEAINFNF